MTTLAAEVRRALARCPLLRSLPADLRDPLVAASRLRTVGAGVVVLRRGDRGRSLVVVVSGRLKVLDDAGAVLDRVGPGGVVGERTVLGASRRANTVVADRDSRVLRVPAAALDAAMAAHPPLVRKLAARAVDNGTARRPSARVRTVALLPAGFGRNRVDDVAAAIGPELGDRVAIVTAASVDRAVGPGSAVAPRGSAREPALLAHLDRIEARHRVVVYLGDPDAPAWSSRCAGLADRVALVADHLGDDVVNPVEHLLSGADLVVCQPDAAATPSSSARWLRPGRAVGSVLHVRPGNAADGARLARHLTGRAQAVVLSGGGARGFAHLGVLAALHDAGHPVDLLVGSSIGALMSALWARHGPSDARRLACDVLARERLFGPTLPIVSFSSGRAITKLLRDHLGDDHVADTWVPWACVSTSLTTGLAVVHDRGPAWEALRASMSIPGLLPPVPVDGDLLVDGAVADHLPLEVAARRTSAPIVAVDLKPDRRPPPADGYGAVVSGWQVLATRLRRSPGEGPSAAAVLLHTMDALDASRTERSARVGLMLRPPAEAGLLDFKAGPGLIEPAYRYAAAALAG